MLVGEEAVGDLALLRLEERLRDHPVATAIPADLPLVPMDGLLVEQALVNLLENAARFSPPGGEIAIVISPWKRAVQVRISDQGRGISPEERERVFDAFYQGDDGGHPGSGLGLTIARAIAHQEGGDIRLEGRPGGGMLAILGIPA